MAGAKGEGWLVWGVLALMLIMGVAAVVIAPGGPGSPGTQPQNALPLPRVSPTDAVISLGDSIYFDASNSTDPDGSVQAFAWEFGDGTTAAGALVTHQYEITGALTVRLEVTDNKGAKNTTSTHVWVNLNQAASGTATKNPLSGSLPSTQTFPLDKNATRVSVSLLLNTSSLAGAKVTVTLADPNSVVVHAANFTLTFGQVQSPVAFTVLAANLTVTGTWTLKVEADYAIPPPGQPSVTVVYSGTVRVEYNP